MDKLEGAFEDHLDHLNATTLCRDAAHAYEPFAKKFGIQHEVLNNVKVIGSQVFFISTTLISSTADSNLG